MAARALVVQCTRCSEKCCVEIVALLVGRARVTLSVNLQRLYIMPDEADDGAGGPRESLGAKLCEDCVTAAGVAMQLGQNAYNIARFGTKDDPTNVRWCKTHRGAHHYAFKMGPRKVPEIMDIDKNLYPCVLYR